MFSYQFCVFLFELRSVSFFQSTDVEGFTEPMPDYPSWSDMRQPYTDANGATGGGGYGEFVKMRVVKKDIRWAFFCGTMVTFLSSRLTHTHNTHIKVSQQGFHKTKPVRAMLSPFHQCVHWRGTVAFLQQSLQSIRKSPTSTRLSCSARAFGAHFSHAYVANINDVSIFHY